MASTTTVVSGRQLETVIRNLVKVEQAGCTERLALLLTTTLTAATLLAQRYFLRRYNRDLLLVHSEDDAKINSNLYRSFIQISKICLPTWKTREFFGSAAFISLFLANALLRVWATRANSRVLSTMLSDNSTNRMRNFFQSIFLRSAVSLLEGLCSGCIQWIRPWLIGCYRERLSSDFQRRFFQKLVYYQSSVLDDRLERADTVIASYCGEFAEHFAELPYYFLLPGLEIITSGYALVQQSGAWSAMVVGSIVAGSVLLMQRLSPPFGRLHSLLLQRNDSYRRMLSTTLDNVENIALHGGGSHTLMCLNRVLGKLKRSLDHMALATGHFNILETCLSSFLTIMANIVAFTAAERGYYKHSVNDVLLQIQYIENLNSSAKNFIVNFRELSHLTEFSIKMWEFDNTLNSIAAGTFIHSGPSPSPRWRKKSTELAVSTPRVYSPRVEAVHDFSMLSFPIFTAHQVVLCSPADVVLIQDFTAAMQNTDDWVIVGDNGCGKTSLIRMLTGLWFPSSGDLQVDRSVKFLIAPQHTYMAPECTLYEQLIFPMEAAPTTDENLLRCVKEAVKLAGAESVIEVAGGYESSLLGLSDDHVDTSFDWTRLSGGQKQRLSLARIFFYKLYVAKPEDTVVAVLDEATSMMDEFEQVVLRNLRQQGIRMISITHREAVIRHHSHILHIKKQGRWKLDRVPNQLKVGDVLEQISPTTSEPSNKVLDAAI